MLNWQNKTLTTIIALILIQSFLFTGVVYPESISKNIAGIYNTNRTLRVPLVNSQEESKGRPTSSFKERFFKATEKRPDMPQQSSLWETDEQSIVRIIISAFEQIKAKPVMNIETIDEIRNPESKWWKNVFTTSGSTLFKKATPYIKRALEPVRGKASFNLSVMADSAIEILKGISQEGLREGEVDAIFEAAQIAITRPWDMQTFERGAQIVQLELDNIIERERSNDGEGIPVAILSRDYWQDVFGHRKQSDLFSQMWPFITVIFSEGISWYSSRGAKIIAKDFVELANDTTRLRHTRIIKDESLWSDDECRAFVAEVLNKAEPGSYTDAYTVLGLEQGAGLDNIHRAYRALSVAYYTESLGLRHIAIENINRAYHELFVDNERLEALERLLDYATGARDIMMSNKKAIMSIKFNSKIPAIGIDTEQIKPYLQKLVLVKFITDDNLNDAVTADAEILNDETDSPQGIIINSQERGYDILFLEEGKIERLLYAVVKIFLIGEFNINESTASEIALGAMRASLESKKFNIHTEIKKATATASSLDDLLSSQEIMKGI